MAHKNRPGSEHLEQKWTMDSNTGSNGNSHPDTPKPKKKAKVTFAALPSKEKDGNKKEKRLTVILEENITEHLKKYGPQSKATGLRTSASQESTAICHEPGTVVRSTKRTEKRNVL